MDPELQRLKEIQQRIEDENTNWHVLCREDRAKPYQFAAETPPGCRMGLSLEPAISFPRQKAYAIKEALEKKGYDVQLAKMRGEYDTVSVDFLPLEEKVNRAQGNGEF